MMGQDENTKAPPRQNKARLVLIVVLGVMLAAVLYRAWWGRSHIETENAQVEGHIVPIAARVGGYVKSVPVLDNQHVQQSQMVVEIDPRDFVVKVAQAEADWANALSAAGNKAQPGEATAKIGAANANAAAAQAQGQAADTAIVEARANAAKARNDLKRSQELAAQKMVSQAQLDAAETAVKVADARVQNLIAQQRAIFEQASAAQQQVAVSSAGLKSAEAKVLAAQAQVGLAKNQLLDTKVLAPVGGIVSKKAVEPGQMIQAGQTLMYLVPVDDLWIVANLKETEFGHIKAGQKAEIMLDAYPDLQLTGTVDSSSAATGARFTLLPPDNATGNFTKVVQRVPVKIKLDQIPAGALLRPGLSATVVIHTK